MPRLIDVWRAIDAEARLVAGQPEAALDLVRGVSRTRVAPPRLPPPADGHLLIVDGSLLATLPAARLLAEIDASGSVPAGLLVAAAPHGTVQDWPDATSPVLVSDRSAAALFAAAGSYLADEAGELASLATELRLATAEAALSDPSPAAPAGLVAARVRRGVAVVADGELLALHPRPAGRALAARFAAAFSRLFGTPSARAAASRRLRDGLWIHEEQIRPGAAVWLFDDLPMARVDEVAAAALATTLRALLRRPAPRSLRPASRVVDQRSLPAEQRMDATLLAVARANGRVAPAARSLGVHRNTVLYRLRVARDQRGIDPRRPEDALRLLREADREDRRPA
ncbi:MAG: PucR family transcriptional regulator [Chloroflexi bacterium]|nr:MAG: PucR family transcriptional regulator [Chloroflexota bacterium]